MSTKLDPEDAIHSLNICNDWAVENIKRLSAVSAVYEFAKDEAIFREGQVHGRIYWVYSGRVRLEMRLPNRFPTALLTVGAGEVLAWSAFLGSKSMTASGIATTETVLLGFEVEALRALCESNHQIGYRFCLHLCQGLSQRLTATRLQLLDLFGFPPKGFP